MRCKDCKFWSLDLENDRNEPWIGECRRYPPTQKQDGEILNSNMGHVYMRTSKFEIYTYFHDYCGEYKYAEREYSD